MKEIEELEKSSLRMRVNVNMKSLKAHSSYTLIIPLN